MQTKICTLCREELEIDNFHKRCDQPGKWKSRCKNCTNKTSRDNYENIKDHHNEKMREHYKANKKCYQERSAAYRRTDHGRNALAKAREKFLSTEKGRASVAKSIRKWGNKNKKKRQAHWKVKDAIRTGKLVRKPCEVCGKTKVDAHHSDYTKPLMVSWLCKDHHKELHRKIICE